MTELHQAAASGDADLVEEILRQNKYDPNQRDVDWNNKTPLHWAAARGKLSMFIYRFDLRCLHLHLDFADILR